MDPGGGLYCLANVGVLDYEVSEKAELSLERHIIGKTGRSFITVRKQSLRRLYLYVCLSFCSQGVGGGGFQAHTQGGG